MADDGDDYPLNCIDDAGDFSGWFAISSNKVCNDFCYWNIPSSKNGTTSNNASTANPHQSTVLHSPSGTVYWTCIYDSADDKSMLSKVVEHKWIDSWATYASHNDMLKTLNIDSNDVPFPYLRCQKGAGERLETWSGDVVKSATFWESNIIISSLIILGEIAALLFFCKRGRILKYEQVGGTEVTTSADGIIDEDISSFQIDEEVENEDGNVEIEEYVNNNGDPRLFTQQYTHQTTYMTTLRCKYLTIFTSRRALYIMRILLVIAFNLLLVFTISFATVSLMEIKASPHFTEGMQKLTPACSDPSLVCPAGNVDIKKESSHWPPLEKNSIHEVGNETIRESKMDSIMQPFSYIIASDAQLYWFNGEFAEMGDKSIPSACSPSDSCGRCTAKHGLSTNQRLKRAWESLISGETDGMNTTTLKDLPIPKTLIMNGDLTAYYHPYEKRAYDSIYNDISGLEYYFPSLGNHDIEHMGGAMFGGDEWLGLPNCNMEHALGYFRSAFCGQIPSFDTDRIVRYDSSNLAYSWDEGRYHFVHSHYYPSYEMASVKYHSSLQWLESDLQVAHDAGLSTILFVHAVQGLNMAMENIILGKNVKAIIAGHTHRCLHRKCEGIYPLKEDQMKDLDSQGVEKEEELGTTASGIRGGNVATAEKCIPAAYDTCQVLNGENLVFARDLASDVTFPTKELKNRERKDKPLCPKPAPFFINETDNSLLCHRVIYSQPNFPFGSVTGETIPIFWSGSSSFETFLKADFYKDRFVINSMSISLENDEVGRYVDLHTVPNAVYPYHSMNDIEETVTYL